MRTSLRAYRILFILCLSFCLLSLGSRANNFYVTNLNDAGTGSLRQAITDANNTATGLPHTVVFNVSGSISVLSALPQITSAGLTIDGGNQITLNAPGGDVQLIFFDINASSVTVKGLTMLNSGRIWFLVEPGLANITIRDIVANNFNGNYMDNIVFVAGASANLTLKNIRSWAGLQNFYGLIGTGFAFFFNGGNQTNLVMDSIFVSTSTGGSSYGGVYFNSASVNGWTFTNSRLTGMVSAITLAGGAPYTASGVQLSNITLDTLGASGYGFYSNLLNNGVSIRNSLFNVNQQNTSYGLRFDNASKNITLDNLAVHGNNVYSCYFSTGPDTAVTITHSTFDNLKGNTSSQAIRFDLPVVGLTMTRDTIDETIAGSAGSGAYGIYFGGALSNATLDSLVINKASANGILANAAVNGFTLNHSQFTGNGVALDMAGNAPHSNVNVFNSSFLNGTNASFGAFQFNAATLPEQFKFLNDTVAYNAGSGLRAYGGSAAITDTITNCFIHDNNVYGVMVDNAPTGVVVTGPGNSIYNNIGGGIGINGMGNCGYTGANRPTLVSSAPLGGGVYQLRIIIPNVVASAIYNVDVYANDPYVSSGSGQYFVGTIPNVSYNNGTPTAYNINYNTGPGLTGRGFFTATLRIPANPCGTSAFSNQIAMNPQGPAGVNNGIVTWLRADDGKARGSLWGDFSGNGASAAQTTSAYQPAFDTAGLNFNPGLQFNGTSSSMQIPNSAIAGLYPFGASARTMITVASKADPTSVGVTFGYGASVINQGYGVAVSGQAPYLWGYNTQLIGTTNGYRANAQAILTGTYNGPDNPNANLYVNGLLNASGNYTWNTATTREANIGISQAANYYWNGDIGEVILYNRVLSPAELQQVCSYLGLKYGITADSGKVNYLASNGSPYWTANSTYKYRITGIGRDTVTALYQRQSLNIDTGIVTLALGSAVAVSNAANTGVIGTDKSFFVFADNGGVTGLSVALTASGLKSAQRMGRVWMVQKTGNWADQPVTLRIAGAGPNNYLLISSDPAFGTVNQELQLDAGGNVTLNSSLLASGSYFTVGGTPRGPGNINNGITLWLRADDGKATGAQWNDYSGNVNGVSQPVAASQATVVNNALNFGRSLRFNGTNNMSAPYNPAFNGTVTIYTVYRQLNAGSYQAVISSRNGNVTSGWDYNINYGANNGRNWQTCAGSPTIYDIQPYGSYSTLRPEIMGLFATPGSGNASKNMYLNGSPLLATPTTNSTYFPNTNNPLSIGSSDLNGDRWNGDIGEAILYNRALNAVERQQIESYLALKYGITLNGGATSYLASNGATTFWNVGTNAGYVQHVTGIGRDSSTGLYQKQSLSVDTGYVRLALGSAVAAANELNTATITRDTSFFVIGDNGGLKSFTGNVQAGSVTFTPLGRVFRVQKTNWSDQAITLATDTTLPLPQDLLISTDPTFATGVTVQPLTRGVIMLNSSQLASGIYFTFADTLRGPGGVNTGIGAWWRADAGGSVSSWADYSGNGHTQTQTTAASQPALQSSAINFNPALNFNGSNYMTSSSVFGTGSIKNSAFFAVAMPTSASAQGGLFGESLSSGGKILAYAPSPDGNMYFYAPNSPIGDQVAKGLWGGAYGNPYLFAFTSFYTGSTINESRNNTNVSTFNGTLTGYSGNNSPFYLGSQVGTNYSYIGPIAELVVYNNSGAMVAGDRQKIMSYLAFKYGLTLKPLPSGGATNGYLASNGTLFWDSTINAGYNLHITGVGRDSSSGLNQLQSVSADTGLVTLALGNTIVASNAANTSVIGVDRSFFVFGDNGGATTYMTGIGGLPGLTTRMARVFKVQKSSWTDQVITMKVTGATGKTYLIVSSDPTFSSGVTQYPFSDTTIHINTSALGNGVYFTFARQTPAPNGVSNGLALWLRADDGVSNGAQWNDQTGNGMNAVQTTQANQPVPDAAAINFNYGFRFNGSNYLQIPNSAISGFFPFGNSDRTIITVGANTNGSLVTYPSIGYGTNSTGQGNGLAYYGTSYAYYYGWGSDLTGTAGTAPINKAELMTGAHTASGSPNTWLYINGGFNVSGSLTWNTNSTNPAYIGQDPGNNRWYGPISEEIVYNRALSTTELKQVHSYLALKYGIPLDSGRTNYVASDGNTYWTANSTYNRRITGIGRDDSTLLNTKQSLSVDTGFVTLALGSAIAPSNQSNTSTINNNKSFFVFGDNGGSVNNFSAAVSGSARGVTLRYGRVWMLQKTANWADQTITLKIQAPGPNTYLLLSNDPAFGSLTAEVPLNPDGTVTFSSSLLGSSSGGGTYFSFGAPLLAPGGVSGHSLWLRADAGSGTTVDGGAVNQWNDQSAFANNVVSQGTAANPPLYKDNQTDDINFNPVMKLNGANWFSGNSMLKTGTYNGAAVFAVNSQVNLGGASGLFFEGCTGSSNWFSLAATWFDGYVYWNAPWSGNSITYLAGNPNNLVSLWTGTSDITLPSNKQQLYLNGLSLVTGNNTSTYTGNNSNLFIGQYNGYPTSFNGRLPEIIVYTSALTATQQQQVNSYMAIKYGITLNKGLSNYLASDGTTTIWTADATYKNSITGIGRDTVEGLLQLQSRNSDTTRLRIAMGLGEIDSTNSANHNRFAANRSYLIWGDDNGAAGFTTAVSGIAGVNYRMGRTWKVQETGSVGNVQVAIPFSAVANPAGAVLLVSNTGSFDATSTVYPLNQVVLIAGVKHYAATLNFTNGQYFSFAANIKAPGGIAGISLWLRPDRGTSSTIDKAPLNAWTDYGNLANTATQNTAASQPVYYNNATANVNFNPVVQFTAANAQFMNLDVSKLPTGTAARTVIGMGTLSSLPAAWSFMISWGAGVNSQACELGYGPTNATAQGSFAGFSNDVTTTNNNFWQVGVSNELMGTWAGNGGNVTLYSKNTQVATPVAKTWNTATTFARIGGTGWSTEYWDGTMGDVMVYPFVLTATQRQQLETYLAIKYGVTMNGGATAYLATDGTTTIWPVDAIYTNSITGIGRDSTEDLNQLQSRNSDTTRLRVVVGLGRIDSVNSANPNSFGADKSYLVWGDDNGASTFQTPLSGNPAVNYRMGRTWKSVVTGSVGSVVVAFPYDVLPNPVQSYLAVSSSAVFDGTSTYIPLTKMTINGKQHWGATVSFASTQYFTVAAFIKSPGGVGLTSLWLRPDKGIQGATDGLAVPLWIDFANQVNNASQSNILNQPTYRQIPALNVNYNPVVTFASASSQYMNLDITKLPTGTAARTVFGTGLINTFPSTNGYIIGWGTASTNTGMGIGYFSPTASAFMSAYNNNIQTAANFWQVGTFNEMMGTWAGSGGNATLYSKMLQVAAPQAMAFNTTPAGTAAIGYSSWSSEYWNGSVGDVIVFNRQLSVAEINRVETYLAIRYGYTIDQTSGAPNSNYTRTDGVPVWTANTTYKYNIAGIGRDDVEGLNQLQSRSINAASIMTVGLGGIAVDNPSNTGAFINDTSYVIWASNSASTAAQATNLPAGYSNTTRMVQQWKLKQTNFSNGSQPLSMAFDVTGFSITGTSPSNFVLLVDNDGDGDLTTGTVQKILSTSYSSAQKLVRFDNVTTIPDGAVITLAFVTFNLQVNAKVYLQAAWNGTSMNTTLKSNGQLPATDPYGLNTTPSVNPNSATAQVVDWVRVELRDPVTPTTVVASRAALLLADGTIVDTNYTQPLSFGVPTTQYYVVIKHRNHLGIMTGSAVDFSGGVGTLDFTGSATATYSRGTNPAQATLSNGINMMWGGDANGDGKIIFTGTGSDADWILNSVLGGDPNGYLYQWSNGDVNMDGQVYYISTNNDRDWILYYPLGGNPGGILQAQLP